MFAPMLGIGSSFTGSKSKQTTVTVFKLKVILNFRNNAFPWLVTVTELFCARLWQFHVTNKFFANQDV